MKQALFIIAVLLACSLQSQSIIPRLDSIIKTRDTLGLLQFCEQWHLETQDCQASQLQNDTIREMYSLLQTVFESNMIFNFSDDWKEGQKPKYLILQDNLWLCVQEDEWDFEKATVELEFEKHKRKRTIVSKKTFILKELRKTDFELYKRAFKEYYQLTLFNNGTHLGKYGEFGRFCPSLDGKFDGVKACYLIDKYKDFSALSGGLTSNTSFYFNSENKPVAKIPKESHYDNIEFISTVVQFQSGYREIGFKRIKFNKDLNKAAIYPTIECYTGYLPYFFEKVDSKWVYRGKYWEK